MKLKWTCDGCRKPIGDSKGYVCVDNVEAMAVMHLREEARHEEAEIAAEQGGVIKASQIQMIMGVHWRAWHRTCDPQPDSSDYWFGVERCRDLKALLEWNAHLGGKRWIGCTDWSRFIQRQLV